MSFSLHHDKSANCQHNLSLPIRFDYQAEEVSVRVTVKLLFLLSFHTELFGRKSCCVVYNEKWAVMFFLLEEGAPTRTIWSSSAGEICLFSIYLYQCELMSILYLGSKTTQLCFIVQIITLLLLIVWICFGQWKLFQLAPVFLWHNPCHLHCGKVL